MKIGILCFGPFGGNNVNGSTTIAHRLSELLMEYDDVEIANVIEVPTAWEALLRVFQDDQLENYDLVIGMGEGFPHFVSVEQMAVCKSGGKDIAKETPPENMLPEGLDVCISPLRWSGEVQTPNLGLPSGSPGVAMNGFDGQFLCNAAHYRLLYWMEQLKGRRAGFIHMPPQQGPQGWEKRTGRDATDYGNTFANVVVEILRHNGWIF